MTEELKSLILTNGNLERQHMPKDYSISVANYYKGGTDNFLLNPKTKRTQPMRGFDENYTDIIDYIVRITHRIWEVYNMANCVRMDTL